MSSRIVQGALCGLLLCILSGAVHAQPWAPPNGNCGGSDDDANGNMISDGCDIFYGFSLDQNGNGIPDEAECPLSALVCTASPTTMPGIWEVDLDWETPLLDFWNYVNFVISCPGLFASVPDTIPANFMVNAGALCGGEFSLEITVTGHCSNSWSLVNLSGIPVLTDFLRHEVALCSTEIIPELDYQFSLDIPGTTVPGQVQVPPNLPHAPFLIDARIFEDSGGDCANPVGSSHGFSMGVETPPGLAVLEGVAHPELVGALSGYPEFFDLDILADDPSGNAPAGWTVGVLYDLFDPFGSNPLSADFAQPDGLGVVRVLYSTSSCPPTGPYTLSFTETLGPANMYGLANPHVRNLVVYQGEAFPAEKSDLTFTITAGGEHAFQRGDCNGISGLTLADAVLVLAYLFSNGGDPACLDACDANDSGSLEMGDAIFLLSYLFAGSGSPPAPHPAEGSDPTQDNLTCESYAAVPCP